jgi:hypothetical protein
MAANDIHLPRIGDESQSWEKDRGSSEKSTIAKEVAEKSPVRMLVM